MAILELEIALGQPSVKWLADYLGKGERDE
jgi:hypothetical protein